MPDNVDQLYYTISASLRSQIKILTIYSTDPYVIETHFKLEKHRPWCSKKPCKCHQHPDPNDGPTSEYEKTAFWH